jgi:type III pantothenate kinase
MVLLLDIGNTHSHLALATWGRLVRCRNIATNAWRGGDAGRQVRDWLGRQSVDAVAVCSVVPWATQRARATLSDLSGSRWFELTARAAAVRIDPRYPKPESIGPDRLANAVAARVLLGAPCLAIDFGTAVTFDVVDAAGRFAGGVIAPGVLLLTSYLHEQTALLPKVELGPVRRAIGRTTEEAIRSAAVHGFRGLVRELIGEIKKELGCPRLPVVATGGYAAWAGRGLPEISIVRPHLTFEGLRLAYKLELESGGDRRETPRR